MNKRCRKCGAELGPGECYSPEGTTIGSELTWLCRECHRAGSPAERLASAFENGYRSCIEDLREYAGSGIVTDGMIDYLELKADRLQLEE